MNKRSNYNLKVKKTALIYLVLILLLTANIPAFATSITTPIEYSFYLDDKLFVQLRNYEESQGNTVTWDGVAQEIVVFKNDKWLYKTKLNSNVVTTPTTTYNLIIPLASIDGRTYIEQSVLDAIHGYKTILKYQFETGNSGFLPIFSDYHDDSNNYETYEMEAELKKNPVETDKSNSLYIKSQNRSDDMFMGYVKEITGLENNSEYNFDVKFDLATDVASGMFGIGGSPGEAVIVKFGIVNVKLEKKLDDAGVFRLNIDHGAQSSEGKDMIILGNISKPEDSTIEGFEFKHFDVSITATTDNKGTVYFIIATDSGFEGLTEYYLDNIEIRYSLNNN